MHAGRQAHGFVSSVVGQARRFMYALEPCNKREAGSLKQNSYLIGLFQLITFAGRDLVSKYTTFYVEKCNFE